MNFEPFYNQYSATTDLNQEWLDSFYETACEIFADESFEDIHKVGRLFYGKGSGLSKAQYYRKKKFVVAFYRWLFDEQKVDYSFYTKVINLKLEDIISDQELDTFYFKNLDAALHFVQRVGEMHGLGGESDMLTIKAIVILSWYGVDLKYMISLKKSDLDSSINTIYMPNASTLQLPKRFFAILKNFADTDMHKGFPMQKLQIYRHSAFLFRSPRQDSMTENNLNCYLKRFNDEAVGQVLNLTALKKNGIFERAFELDDGQHTANSLIQEVAGIDRQMAFGYAKFYERWKEKYWNKNAEMSQRKVT